MTTRGSDFLGRAAALAGMVLAASGALALWGFFYVVYYYTLTGERQFRTDGYAVVYYLLPLAAAIGLFASLRLSPTNRINVFLLLVTSCLSVGGLELFMQWRLSSLYASTKPMMSVLGDAKDKSTQAAALGRQWGIEIDTRTADEALASLHSGGNDPVPIITPSNNLLTEQPDGTVHSVLKLDGQEVLPLGAVSNRTTLMCNDAGQWVHYDTDLHGFNNSNHIWHSDQLDVAAIGDSFAQGYCVPAGQDFVALIRQRYPATLNLGIAGDGPLMMLATLKQYLPRFRPKIVLWFYFEGNDLIELEHEGRNPLLRRYLTDGFTQPALERQDDVDRAIVAEMPRLRTLEQTNRARRLEAHPVDAVLDFAKLSTLRRQLGLVGGVDNPADVKAVDASNMAALRQVLGEAQAEVGRWKGELLFVYLPDWSRYAGYTPPSAQKHGEVLSIAGELGIPTLDIDAAFVAHGDPVSLFPFRRAAHYNAGGHQVVAEEVLKNLSTREWHQ